MYSVRLWSVRHARGLNAFYKGFENFLVKLAPVFRAIGYERLERPVALIERNVKGLLFDCKMCGQCVLSSTGMSCSMNCPKNLRNGPCGGVRANGHCEVKPEMRCVWVEGFKGAERMPGAIKKVGGVRHRFRAATKDQPRGAALNHLRGENYCLHSGRAHHIDRAGGGAHGQSRTQGDLTSDIHPQPRPKHVADDHVIHARRLNSRQRRLRGEHAELDCGKPGQCPEKAALWRAFGGDNPKWVHVGIAPAIVRGATTAVNLNRLPRMARRKRPASSQSQSIVNAPVIV